MQKRHQLALMAFLAIFICYIDRVAISVAIIPMVETYGWAASWPIIMAARWCSVSGC